MTPDEQEKLVKELETALDRLQALYNQYFMGIEKLEPLIPRKDVDRRIAALRHEKIRNTALRFRFQTQIQKYNTHSSHWRRICRQIEEGTYERDLRRAKKRVERLDEAGRADEALRQLGEDDLGPAVYDLSQDAGLDLDDPFGSFAKDMEAAGYGMDLSGANESTPRTGTPVPPEAVAAFSKPPKKSPVAEEIPEVLADFFSKKSDGPPPVAAGRRVSLPPPPPPSRRAPPPAAKRGNVGPQKKVDPPKADPTVTARGQKPVDRSGGVTEDRMKTIYRSYVAARKQTNEPVEGVSYEKIAKLLTRQLNEKGDISDFKVVIRAGKAVIKTVKQ